MHIELTKEEYKTLLTLSYCGEQVLNSHKTKGDTLSKKIEELEQKIFSFAKDAGLEKWIEYDAEMAQYFPTLDMEDKLHDYIDQYNLRQKKHKKPVLTQYLKYCQFQLAQTIVLFCYF